MRSFEIWLSNFRESISDYSYYVDFQKVYRNVKSVNIELNILNSLIGSRNIEEEFSSLIKQYPETIKCIPLLLAVRERELYAMDEDGLFLYSFKKMNHSPEEYRVFMRKTGLFELMEKHIIHSLVDYVTGVETGLDSNGRKNRGGHLMEKLVERHIIKSGFVLGETFFKEVRLTQFQKTWSEDLRNLTAQWKNDKRFDFIVKTETSLFAVETNFYSSSGSKLNETARSYKNIAQDSAGIKGFEFVWFTDGRGWLSARNNLRDTFLTMEHMYNINDMENGIINKVFV